MFVYNQISRKSSYRVSYENFLGVDFSCHPTQVDKNRSPWAPNLISDVGGFPEKRAGWETLHTLEGRINGIYTPKLGQVERFIIHSGTKLYMEESGSFVLLQESIHDEKSSGVIYDGRLWLLTGGQYLVVGFEDNSVTVKDVATIATIPTTWISRSPTGGGTIFESANLLNPKQTCSFLGDETSTMYQLDNAPIDDVPLMIIVNGEQKSEGIDYSVDREKGQVTFVSAPGVSTILGKDNITITYSKTVEGYTDRIKNCTIVTTFGMSANDFIFLSGNKDYKNHDWHSLISNPSYFPDTGYSVVGDAQSSIMGYLKIGESLAIIKEDTTNEPTVYLRDVVMIEDGVVAFPTKAGISGAGAATKGCIINFRDDPLFLSPSGIYAITTRAVTQEKCLQKRSRRIDARLCKEENLNNITSIVWGDYLVISANKRCYVADARAMNQGEYEWYHWENVPARVFKVIEGVLWFGTDEGNLCRFKTTHRMNRYSDDGAPIVASWSTKQDDDGDFMRKKSMIARGCGILIKPYTRSSAKVFISTEKDFDMQIAFQNMDIWDFSDFDFTRVSFNTSESPQVVAFNTTIKSYNTIMLTVLNDVADEGFGIFKITRSFTCGRFNR